HTHSDRWHRENLLVEGAEKATRNFCPGNKFGQGSFGRVYLPKSGSLMHHGVLQIYHIIRKTELTYILCQRISCAGVHRAANRKSQCLQLWCTAKTDPRLPLDEQFLLEKIKINPNNGLGLI
ncbi:hypothetical protein BAE44_0019052, partial [Dichanthelium oligosanthes]